MLPGVRSPPYLARLGHRITLDRRAAQTYFAAQFQGNSMTLRPEGRRQSASFALWRVGGCDPFLS